MFFPIHFYLSVVFKTEVAAVCVISSVNLVGKIQGLPVTSCLGGSGGCLEYWRTLIQHALNCPRDICSPASYALARSTGYPKGDLPTALVVVRHETRAWCCAFSFPFLISLKTQLPCPAAT